jgi:hypothetical protein
VRDF